MSNSLCFIPPFFSFPLLFLATVVRNHDIVFANSQRRERERGGRGDTNWLQARKRKEGGGGEPSLFIMGPGHGRKKGKCPRSGSNAFSHKKTYVLRRRERGNGKINHKRGRYWHHPPDGCRKPQYNKYGGWQFFCGKAQHAKFPLYAIRRCLKVL